MDWWLQVSRAAPAPCELQERGLTRASWVPHAGWGLNSWKPAVFQHSSVWLSFHLGCTAAPRYDFVRSKAFSVKHLNEFKYENHKHVLSIIRWGNWGLGGKEELIKFQKLLQALDLESGIPSPTLSFANDGALDKALGLGTLRSLGCRNITTHYNAVVVINLRNIKFKKKTIMHMSIYLASRYLSWC